MQMKVLRTLGQYLRQKRNFMNYWLVTVGLPISVLFVWALGGHGGFLYWLFLVALAFVCAYVSGLLMWQFFSGYRGDSEKER